MSSNPQNLADDGLERIKALDVLTTLPELLTHHLTVRPDDVAYKVYDNASKSWKDLTFKNVYDQVHAWRHAFAARSELVRGDRVAMLLPNCPEAVFFDLSALSNTLVPVPLHAIDTPKSSAFILNDSGAKVLVTNKLLKWKQIREAAETPDYVPDGARLVRICGLCLENGKEVDFSPEDRENLLKGMPDEGRRMADAMYERMLFGNKAYKELFRALEVGETPVLFHCSAGKDRTGVAAMLILLALGASDKTIAEDFEKTNIWRRPELEAVWAEHAEEIAADPARKDFYLGVFGVHPESAPFVLSIIRERYGSADAYLEAEYGLTPARLMRLRRMYLE